MSGWGLRIARVAGAACVSFVTALSLVVAAPSPSMAASFLLSGTVKDQSSNGVAAAVALQDPSTGAAAGSTTADAGGAFSMVAPGGTWDVVVTPPVGSDLQVSTIRDFVVDGDRTLNVLLTTNASTVQFRGILRNQNGVPIPGQAMALFPGYTGGPMAETAADGSFSLRATGGQVSLTMSYSSPWPPTTMPAYRLTTSSFTLTSDTVQDLTLPQRTLDVVVVGPDGAAVAGASVYLRFLSTFDLFPGGPANANYEFRGTTGSGGHVSVPALSGIADVYGEIGAPAGSTLATRNFHLTSVPGGPLTFTLPRGVTYSGVVRNRELQPVVGATVAVQQLGVVTGPRLTTTTAADGSFRVPGIAPGSEYMLSVSAEFGAAQSSGTPWLFGASAEELTITSDTSKTLTLVETFLDVTVVDAGGNPVPGATMTMYPEWISPSPYASFDLAPGMPATGSSYDRRTTNASGRARITMLPMAPVQLVVTADGFMSEEVHDLSVTVDGSLRVQMTPVGTVYRRTGVLRQRGGAPIAGARMQSFRYGTCCPIDETTSAPDGAFALALPSEKSDIAIDGRRTGDDDLPSEYHVVGGVLSSASSDIQRDITLSAVHLDVTVIDSSGRPVPGVGLKTQQYVAGKTALWSGDVSRVSFLEDRVTDDVGKARMAFFPYDARASQLPTRIEVTPPPSSGLGPLTLSGFTVTADDTLTVVLATFRGTLAGSNGSSAGGQTVSLVPPGGAATSTASSESAAAGVSAITGADGSFALTVPPGSYGLEVEGGSTGGSSLPRTYEVHVPTVDLSTPKTQNLILPIVTFDVTVLAPDGLPVPFADVVIPCQQASFRLFADATATGSDCPSATTNGNGVARVALFPASNVSFTVTPPPSSGLRSFSGAGVDLTRNAAQTVSLGAARQFSRVVVSTSGTGVGTVISAPVGIRCPPACSAPFATDADPVLTTSPDPDSYFDGWTGACAGSGPCALDMSAARSVGARFVLKPYLLTLTMKGSGIVTGPGIACPGDCTARFFGGTAVKLTAQAATGFKFGSWRGSCTGKKLSCTLTVNTNADVKAIFKRL
jgi:hypothetical protein